MSRIEEINIIGSSNEVVNEIAIIPTVLSEKDSNSEDLQSSDGEVDDISSCLSHKGDDNSSEYEIDLASDMDEYEEIPTADDHNNVIDNADADDHNQDPYMEQVIYMLCITLQNISLITSWMENYSKQFTNHTENYKSTVFYMVSESF